MKMDWIKGPWLAMTVGFLLAAGFVVFQPGSIMKDAGEYDALAQSILQGRYEIGGQASMVREPGYPLFRAVVLLVTGRLEAVLWVQVLLFAAIIWLIWDSLRHLDARLAMVGAWSAALSYGLAVYASRHLLEMFSGFLVALIAWFAMRAMQSDKPWKDLIGFSFSSAALILTRVPLALIPIALGIMLAWNWKKEGLIEVVKRGGLFTVILIVLVSPWVIRNGKTFGVWSITGRTGIQVAARAFKADAGWSGFVDSFGSVVFGHTIYSFVAPSSHPILTEHWKRVWNRLDAWRLDRNPIEADLALRQEATALIFSDTNHFLLAFAWTWIDFLRLNAFPSLFSPEFGIENMFWAKSLDVGIGPIDFFILAFSHLLQLAWWIGIVSGLFFGWFKWRWRFSPLFMILALWVAHLPADNIPRYAAPIYPWLVLVAVFGWSILAARVGRYLSTFRRS